MFSTHVAAYGTLTLERLTGFARDDERRYWWRIAEED
jgi:DNA repair protein RadC